MLEHGIYNKNDLKKEIYSQKAPNTKYCNAEHIYIGSQNLTPLMKFQAILKPNMSQFKQLICALT